jgi:hypothetical protein
MLKINYKNKSCLFFYFLFFIFIKMITDKIRIYEYKDTDLHNICYDTTKNEFHIKKNNNSNYFT